MFFLLSWTLSRGFLDAVRADEFLRSGPKVCVKFLPPSAWPHLYESLVCGVDLPAGEARQLFVDTGLIHVMVVSGSHLVFLEVFLGFLSPLLRLAVLGGYSFLVGFQAPVMRAFLRRAIGPALVRQKGLTSLQIEAATVVLALSLYPPWILSRSFLMSWMCGLAMCSPRLWVKRPHIDLAVKCYAFLLPFCGGSPLSILWNILLAPFVGILLFPASLLVVIFPPLHGLTDILWTAFIALLKLGPQSTPWLTFFSAQELCWLPAVVHMALLVMEVRWRRAHAFSYS